MENEEKIDAGEYGAATIPRDELVDAYRYFEWKKSGEANGEPPPRLHRHSLPTPFLVQAWEESGSFETWIRRTIGATHYFRNAVPVMPHPVLPGIDDELEKAYAEAFAESQKYYDDLSSAMEIAENVFRDVLMEKVYLPDEASYKMGKADGMGQLKPLYDDLKKTERKLAAARRKAELAQGRVKGLERELEKKTDTISKIEAARKFYARCRDFAKAYCRNVKDNAAEAARKLMGEDWFIKGVELHDSKWFPKESSGSAIGHAKEAIADNLAKDIQRWRTANWKLPFEG